MNEGMFGPHRRILVALLAALVAGGALAACYPPPPPAQCERLDFKTATVEAVPTTATSSQYRLVVTGAKTGLQTVELAPRTYVQQPEYWGFEIRACPAAGPPPADPGPYEAAYFFTGSLGTKGIEIVGVNHSQRIDLPGSIPPADTAVLLAGWWRLDPASLGVPVPAGQYTLVDFRDGKVQGMTAGCNTYSGPFTVTGNRISIGALTTTDIACEPVLATAEAALLRKLGSATTFSYQPIRFRPTMTPSRLTLTGPEGTLVFDWLGQPRPPA
jgi:heat shock protein HslJ